MISAAAASALPPSIRQCPGRAGDAGLWHAVWQGLPAGDHGEDQVLALGHGVDQDCQQVQRHGREQGLPEDGVEGGDEIGDPGGHKLSQRPLDRDVIVDVEPGQRLAEQQGKEENHHPATRRVVAGLAVRLMTERPGEVSCGVSRRNQKAGEARRFAAEDAPQQAEEQQREQHVAGQRVPVHPVESPGDIGRCDQRHDQPVKETRRRVPDQDLARDVARLCHRHRSSLEIRQTPRSRPQNCAPHPLPRGLSRHGQIVDRRTGKSSIRHRQGRTSVC